MKSLRNCIGVVFITLFFSMLAAITLTVGCAPPEELGGDVIIPDNGQTSPTGQPTTLQGKVLEASWTKPESGLGGVQVTLAVTGGTNLTATTSDAGLFVLHNVPVGTHGLSFFKANYEIADVQVVILSTDLGKTKTLSTQPRSFRRDSDTSRGMIQGQVLDENGTALDGALVKTDLKDPTTGQAYSATTTSVGMSKAGMFQLTVPALATYNLTISRQNYITYKLKSPVTNIVPQRLESVDIGSVQLAPTAPGGTGGDDDDGGGQPAPADAKFRPLKGRVVDSITKLGLNNVKVETEVGLEAFTAADYIHTGVFTFPLSPVGTYRLFATPPPHLGYDALDRGIEITIPPGSGTYELTQKIELKRSTEDVGRVFGQVLDALTAQPVNGATVELGGQITFTGRIGDHYGMYEFPRVMTSTISYYITVRKLGYIPQSQTVKVTTADQEYLQNFTLEPFTSDPDKGIVPGTVIEKDNFDPVAGATVWIETWDGEPLRHNTDDPPQPELGATGATVEAVTVVDGSFVFQNIPASPVAPPQYYTFHAEAGSAYLPGYASQIVVEEGRVTDPPVRIDMVGIKGSISGFIYEDKNGDGEFGSGEGIPGATIEIFGFEDEHKSRTRLDGWYRMENVPLTATGEAYFIVSGAPNYLPDAFEGEVTLTPDNPNRDDISIALRPAKVEGLGHVSGVVTDVYGNVLQGVSVELDFIYQREGVFAEESTRFDGSFFMVNRAVGNYLIRAAQNVKDKYIPVLKEVRVSEGSVASVNFVLNVQTRQLRGIVTDEESDLPLMEVEVMVLDVPKDKQVDLTTLTAANGSFVIPKMPVGNGWRIQFTLDSYDTWVEIIDVPTLADDLDEMDIKLALIVGGISGTVYEDDNSNGIQEEEETTPIPGITITLTPEKGGESPQSVVTGTDGKYSFNRVPIGMYTLRAANDSYYTEDQPFTMNKENLDMSMDFILALKRGNIAGIITDKATDDGIAGATVEIMGTNYATLTDISGSFRFDDIPESTYNLIAYSITYETGTSPGIKVEAGKTTTDSKTMFKLDRKSGSIAGQVVDADSLVGIDKASVVVVGTALTTKTTEDGLFTFEMVPIGVSYTLKAAKVGYGVNQVPQIKVKASKTTSQDIELNAGTGSLVGVAKDGENSQGLSGVSVEVVGTDYRSLTLANGSYTMSNLPIGTYQLIAYSISYEVASVTGVEVKAGEITSVDDFELTPKIGTISGQVTDGETGAGLKGVLVRVSDSTKSVATADDGSFSIEGIRVASGYTVTFTKSGYQKAEKTGVNVFPGKTADASVEMDIGHGIIAGTVTDRATALGISGATVEVVGTEFKVTTSASGAYRIEDLPESVYTIIAYHDDYDTGRLTGIRVAAGAIKSIGTALFLTKKKGNIAGEIIDGSTGIGISEATIRVSGTTLEVISTEFGNYNIGNVPQGEGMTVEVFASGYERISQGDVQVLANQTSIVDFNLTSKTGSVAGQIYDQSTGRVVSNSIVRVYRTSKQTRSGADGSYIISGIPTSVSGTTVEASAAGYATEQVGGVPITAGMTTTVDVGLAPTTGAVSGLVYNETTGDGLAGATVRLKGTSLSTLTDTTGTYTMIEVPLFLDGTTIEAVAVGFQRGETGGVITKAGETVTADVSLQPTAGQVSGQVVEKGTNIPIKDALVKLSGAPKVQAKTVADGTFTLADVPTAASGSTLEVTAVGYGRATVGSMLVFPGRTTTVNIVMEQANGILAGRLDDANTGMGIEDAEVRIKGTSLSKATDKDGNYTITGVPVLEAGTVDFVAMGYTTLSVGSVTINSGETTYLDVSLDPATGTITGQVRNAFTSDILTGAQLRILGSKLTTSTDTSGYYTFDSVPTALDGMTLEISAVGFDTFQYEDTSVRSGESITINADLVPSTGSLVGRITDEAEGKVIEGATVRLIGTAYTVTSDVEGQYKVENIPTIHSGKTLEVSARGFALERISNVDIVPGTISSLDVELSSRVGSVAGEIIETISGQPITNATIRIVGTHFEQTTDRNGQYKVIDVLAAEGYTLEVVASGYGISYLGDVDVPAGGVVTANVSLSPSIGTLAGQIRDSVTTEAVKGAQIRLLGSRFSTVTSAEGYYLFENLPGSLSGNTLEVSMSNYSAYYAENVRIAPGEITSLDIFIDPSTGSLAGRITSETEGTAIEEATVRLIGTAYTVVSDSSGEYFIEDIPTIHSGKTLEVSAQGYALKQVASVDILAGTVSSLDIELSSRVGIIAGEVTETISGQLIKDATVRIVGTHFEMVTSATGQYKVEDVPAADGYTLEIVASGYDIGYVGGVDVPAGGVVTANVALAPSIGTLAGQVRDSVTDEAVKNAQVRLLGSRFSSETDSEGYYLFENIPGSLSGNTLEISMSNYSTYYAANVRIAPGEISTLDIFIDPSTGSLAGRITSESEGTAIEKASVRLIGTAYMVVSDASGEYLINNIPIIHSGKTIEVSAQGYALRQVAGVDIVAGTISALDIELSSRVGIIAGEVTETISGQLIKDATVRIVGTHFEIVTSSTGQYKMEDVPTADGYTLEIVASGYDIGYVGSVDVPAGGVVTANVALAPSIGTLAGQVKDSITDEPLKDVQVRLLGSRFSSETDNDGYYTFEDIPGNLSGNTLEFSLTSYSTYYAENVAIEPGEISTLNITLDSTSSGVAGRIIDEATEIGVGGATVRILGTSFQTTSSTVSQALGAFEITGVPVIHNGKTVEVIVSGYATKLVGNLELTAGTTSTLDIYISRTMGTITGQVRNSVSGKAIANVTVRMMGTVFEDQSSSDGLYIIENIPAATGYTVEAVSLGFTSVRTGDVEIVAGGVVTVNFSITADVGAVAGQVMDSISGTPVKDVIVKIGGTALPQFEAQTDSEGFYAINEIPLDLDGLTLEFFDPNYQSLDDGDINIAAGQVTTVDAVMIPNTGTIAGYITDAITENGIQGVSIKLKGTQYGTTSDYDGSYTIVEVPLAYSGRTLEVRMDGYFMKSQSDIDLVAGETTFADLFLQRRVGNVTGTIYSATDGLGLNQSIVRVVGTDLEALTTSDGRYTITGIPVQANGETVETISALLSAYGEQVKNVTIYAGSTSVLDFELTKQTGGITGVITDAGTAEGVTNATVLILGTIENRRTEEGGLYTFEELSVMTGATVEVRASGYQTATVSSVDVSAGSVTTVNVSLQQNTGTVAGQITDATTAEGISEATVRVVGTARSAITDNYGIYKIDKVPVLTGTTIEVTAANYQRDSAGNIDISPGETTTVNVTLDPTTGSITGIITDSKSTAGIAGSTVRIVGSALSMITAEDGTYTIDGVPVYLDGTTIEITKSGYRQNRVASVSILPGQTTTVNVELTKSVGAIAGVVTNKSTGGGLAGSVVRISGTSLSTTTSIDGSYLIEDVPTATGTTVEAFATGFLSSAEGGVSILPAETTTVDLKLDPTIGSLVGQITDSTTQGGISGAIVRVTGTSLVATTSNDGTYDIPEVPITTGTTIEAFKINYELGFKSSVVIEPGTTTTADIELTPSVGVIVGQVLDSVTKQGIPGATARVAGTMLSTTTLEDGSYTIVEVPTSASGLTVEATAQGYERGTTSGVVVDPGSTTTSVDIILSPTSGAVAGQIIDQSTGDGLGGATVRVAGTFLSATTAIDGSYVIVNVAVTTGTTIEAVAVGYETEQTTGVVVKAGASTTVDLSLVPKKGSIAGIVTDRSTAQGIAGATVRVGGTSLLVVTATDGTYAISAIPVMTGTTIEAFASGYSPGDVESVTIKAGESTTVNISLELTTGSLAGVVRDLKTARGIPSAIVRVLGTALSTLTNDDGTYLIESVPVITGTTVEAVANGYILGQASDITVLSGTTATADIDLSPNVGIVTGQITDASTSAGIALATVRVAGTALSARTETDGSYTIEEVPVLTGTTVEVFASNYQRGEETNISIVAGEAILVNIALQPTSASISGVIADEKTGTGLSGATIRVSGTSLSAVSAADGSYTIASVPVSISGTTVEAFKAGYDNNSQSDVELNPGGTTTVDLDLLPSTSNISGVVTNKATGSALSGATVRVAGTSLFAITGGDGSYSIVSVPVSVSGTTVEANATGYVSNYEASVALVAGETTSVDIELLPRVGYLTGQIVDSTTQGGVSGAVVRVVGTLLSTVTAGDGTYSMEDVPVMTGGTVEAFIVGYTKGVTGSVDVEPGTATTVDIEISPNIGTIVGQVTDASTFLAVSGATIRVAGSALSARSDVDGIFLIGSVPTGTGITVEAYAPGFVTDREGDVTVAQGAVTTVDMSLFPSMGVLAGQITDSSTGAGISNATVRVSGTSLFANTAGDGTYSISNVPARTGITVEVSSVGYQYGNEGGLEVKYGETTIVDLNLTPNTGSIVGIITNTSTGSGLSGATIRISGTSLSTASSATGEYEFESVPIGASGSTVEAYATGFTMANEGSVDVVAGQVTMVNLSLYPNTGSMSGIVFNQATGSGLSGATVRILGTSISQVTAGDGSFTIVSIPTTTGSTVEAYMTGFTSVPQGGVEVKPGETTSVDLELIPKTGTLVGLVLDETTAEGISGAAVRVMGTSLSALTENDGSYIIADVPVSTGSTVEAFSSGFRSSSSGGVVISPGQTTSVDLDLTPTTGIVAGQVLNRATGTGLSGASVKVVGTALQVSAASDGSFSIEGVPTTTGTTVEAFASGFVSGSSGGVVVNPGEATTVTVYLSPNTGVIAGMVTNSKTFQGISGATVRIAGTQRQGLTDSGGMFSITDVPVTTAATTVEVFFSGFTSSKEGDVLVRAGETITVDVELTPNVGSIAGVVRKYGTSTPISGATVRVIGTALAEATDGNGDFNIENIPVMGTTLEVSARGYQLKNDILVTISSGEVTSVNIDLELGTGNIAGVVTDSTTAQGLSGATVRVSGTDLSTATGGDGSYSIADVPLVTSVTVEAFFVGYENISGEGNTLVAVESGSTVTADLELSPLTGGIVGVVTDFSTGRGISGANVRVVGTSLVGIAGSNGAYTVNSVPTKVTGTTLEFFAPDYQSDTVSSVTITSGEFVTVNKSLYPTTGAITGRITDSKTRAGVSGATVRIAGTSLAEATDNDGMYTIENITVKEEGVTVEAFNRGYTSTAESFDLIAGSVVTVDLAISPNVGSIAGQVTDATTASPIADAKVRVAGTQIEVESDSDGLYLITNVEAGTGITLEATAADFSPESVGSVTVTAGSTTTASIGMRPITGSLVGQITDASTGSGVTNATVRVVGTEKIGETEDATGQYTITGIPVQEGTTIQVITIGYSTETDVIDIVGGQATVLDFALAPKTGYITGSVRDSVTNQGISGARVSITGTALSDLTDGEGLFNIANVEVKGSPGYTLAARHADYNEDSITDVTVDSGETTSVTISIDPSTGSLVGQVVDSGTGASISGATVRISGTSLSDQTDGNGAYELDRIPLTGQTREVNLTFTAPNYTSVTGTTTEITFGQTTLLDQPLTPNYGTVAGTVMDAGSGSGISGATVRLLGTLLNDVTDGTGNFSITNVPVKTGIEAEATASTYGTATEEVTMVAGSVSTIVLTLTRATGTIVGLVTDELDGRGISGATVRVVGSTIIEETDANGLYEIENVLADANGGASVEVTATNYDTGTGRVDITPGSTATIDVTIEPTVGHLTGLVIDTDTGLAISGASVRITGTQHETNSDGTGLFEISNVYVDLSVGITLGVTLEVSMPEYESLDEGVAVTRGVKAYKLLEMQHVKGTITGQITNASTGDEVPGARVQVRGTGSSENSAADGSYLLEDVPVAEGGESMIVDVTATGYLPGEGQGTLVRGGTVSIDVPLTPNIGSVAGLVTDFYSGTALEGAIVRVRGTSRDDTTGIDGSYLIPSILVETGGTREVTLEFVLADYQTTTEVVEISGGSTVSLDGKIKPLTGLVTGFITDSTTGEVISAATVRLLKGGGLTDTTGDDGAFEFANISTSLFAGASVEVVKEKFFTNTESTIPATFGSGGILTVNMSIELTPSIAKIEGTVTDQKSGQPISGALVLIKDTGKSATTDDTGAYEITSISVGVVSGVTRNLVVSKIGFTSVTSSDIQFDPGVTVSHDLELPPTTGTVTGTIYDAITSASALPEGTEVVIKDTGYSAEVDVATGIYEINGISVELVGRTIEVTAHSPGYQVATADPYVLKRGEIAVVDLALLRTTGAIAGQVVDLANGYGLEGASVTVVGTSLTETTAADGTYLITAVPASTGLTIEATLSGYESKAANVTITTGESISANFSIEPLWATVWGIVYDTGAGATLTLPGGDVVRGLPVSGVTVKFSNSLNNYVATTGDDGTYTVTGVRGDIENGYSFEAVKQVYATGSLASEIVITPGATVEASIPITLGEDQLGLPVMGMAWVEDGGGTAGQYDDNETAPAGIIVSAGAGLSTTTIEFTTGLVTNPDRTASNEYANFIMYLPTPEDATQVWYLMEAAYDSTGDGSADKFGSQIVFFEYDETESAWTRSVPSGSTPASPRINLPVGP